MCFVTASSKSIFGMAAWSKHCNKQIIDKIGTFRILKKYESSKTKIVKVVKQNIIENVTVLTRKNIAKYFSVNFLDHFQEHQKLEVCDKCDINTICFMYDIWRRSCWFLVDGGFD